MKPKIAITAGDINGVGYEVILKALNDPHLVEICTPIIYGANYACTIHRKTLEDISLTIQTIKHPKEANDRKVSLINCHPDTLEVVFGEATAQAGEAAYLALERACADLKEGAVQAIVTAPINKDAIHSDRFNFNGHTEYLAAQFGTAEHNSLMMLVNELMRVALVTNHTPIAEVAAQLSTERIVAKLRTLQLSLRNDFTIRKPRIAVLALNPHAGDNGLLGSEEQTIIAPAIRQANTEGITAFGPYSADGFFGSGEFRKFDAILAMYHDQGLIPFKTLDMGSGVNYTAGLEIVRTSPDHGTAYGIAGKNQANETSFRYAIYTALDVLKERAINAEIQKNPLQVTEKRTNNRE